MRAHHGERTNLRQQIAEEPGRRFHIYTDQEVELVGYTTCDGCPGGNIEYAGDEMLKNGAEVIHLSTGFIVGYPPCPYIETFKDFLEAHYNIKAVISPTMADGATRIAYH